MRLLLFLAAIAFAFPIRAEYKMGEAKPVKTVTTPRKNAQHLKRTKKIEFPRSGDKKTNPEDDILLGLSKMYAIPIDKLQYFRSLKHGYEEIVPALIVAREAQVEAGRVLKMRMEQKTWKDIAGEFHIDLKPLNEEVVAVLKPIRQILPKSALTQRAGGISP